VAVSSREAPADDVRETASPATEQAGKRWTMPSAGSDRSQDYANEASEAEAWVSWTTRIETPFHESVADRSPEVIPSGKASADDVPKTASTEFALESLLLPANAQNSDAPPSAGQGGPATTPSDWSNGKAHYTRQEIREDTEEGGLWFGLLMTFVCLIVLVVLAVTGLLPVNSWQFWVMAVGVLLSAFLGVIPARFMVLVETSTSEQSLLRRAGYGFTLFLAIGLPVAVFLGVYRLVIVLAPISHD
jgi:hypothetical protein